MELSTRPLVRWANPIAGDIVLDIAGPMWLGWLGYFPVQTPVDVAMVRYSPSTGQYVEVRAQTIDKPTPDQSEEWASFAWDIKNVSVAQGEQLLLTLRLHTTVAECAAWNALYDGSLTYTLVQGGVSVGAPALTEWSAAVVALLLATGACWRVAARSRASTRVV